jgi:iron complex transport system permease protein
LPAQRRYAVATPLLLGVLVLLSFGSLAAGARSTAPDVVWAALTTPGASDGDHLVVLARMARTVDGLVVGAALGLSGATMQAITRNPLADPGILGVNAGASLAVIAALALGVGSLPGMAVAATVGALVAFVVVYAIAAVSPGGAQPITLAIGGAAMGAGLTSIVAAIALLRPAALERFRFWQAGVLGTRGLGSLPEVALFLGIGAVLCLSTARVLNQLALGDDVARSLGSPVRGVRVAAALGAVLLAGTATALVGPVGFVGLVVPHLVRLACGPDHRFLLPLSMLAGAALLVGADIVGRTAAPPGEIAVGVMTALLGAPIMIVLVRQRVRVRL